MTHSPFRRSGSPTTLHEPLLTTIAPTTGTGPGSVGYQLAANLTLQERVGYIQAFLDRQVIDAIQSGYHRKVAVALFEWTGPFLQVPIADWSVLSDEESVKAFAATLQKTPRILYGGGTAVGAAIRATGRAMPMLCCSPDFTNPDAGA